MRLLGVAVTHFEEDGAPVQETLFDAAALGGDDRADATQGAALIRDENEAEPQAIFTAELVPNPREDNTVFIYSIRTVKQIS